MNAVNAPHLNGFCQSALLVVLSTATVAVKHRKCKTRSALDLIPKLYVLQRTDPWPLGAIRFLTIINLGLSTWEECQGNGGFEFGSLSGEGSMKMYKLYQLGLGTVISAIVLLAGPPAGNLTVDGKLTVTRNTRMLENAQIDGHLGIGVIPSAAASLQVQQPGSGVGIFLGDRKPFGQALFETDLTAPATHAWFAENGNRVFSVTGGGDGFFKGSLDVGGDAKLRSNVSMQSNAQIDGFLVVGTDTSGLAFRPVGPPPTLNVLGNTAIRQDTHIGGVLFIGSPPPNTSGFAVLGSNTKLRVWGDASITGNQSIIGNQSITRNQSITGNQSISSNQSIGGNQSFGMRMGQMINLFDTTYGIGVQDSGFYLRTDFDFFWYRNGKPSNNFGDAGGGHRLMQLDRDGQLLVASSVVTPVLQITGGNDLAEPFKMSRQDIPKGAVVIIDEENAGHLKLSEGAYDRRVAGIVSGANGIKPGISLSQGVLEGGQNVALSGRVYVLADASSGPIRPGDLLTTSNTPGYAMKVTDYARAQGAVIGKAMSGLKEGKGMVLVLVTLQ